MIEKLIERMMDETDAGSRNSISWKAYREAEKITDPN